MISTLKYIHENRYKFANLKRKRSTNIFRRIFSQKMVLICQPLIQHSQFMEFDISVTQNFFAKLLNSEFQSSVVLLDTKFLKFADLSVGNLNIMWLVQLSKVGPVFQCHSYSRPRVVRFLRYCYKIRPKIYNGSKCCCRPRPYRPLIWQIKVFEIWVFAIDVLKKISAHSVLPVLR